MSPSSALVAPVRWNEDELEAARQVAIQRFRQERIEEPRGAYVVLFDRYEQATRHLFSTTQDLARLREVSSKIISDPDQLVVFRYLAGPPMSEDDLKAVADVQSLATGRLRKRPTDVEAIVETVISAIDPRRFGWLEERRTSTERERETAVKATATLIATQRLATKRRNEGKELQEGRVRQMLVNAGFREVGRRDVAIIVDAPGPGTFCGESRLGTRKADFLVGLYDSRVMPIECKVSNSFLNSIKRLNNDAAAKAEVWRRDLGTTQVVPTAVLSGLYKLHNLVEAQDRGLALFWAHDLEQLINWITRTRSQ